MLCRLPRPSILHLKYDKTKIQQIKKFESLNSKQVSQSWESLANPSSYELSWTSSHSNLIEIIMPLILGPGSSNSQNAGFGAQTNLLILVSVDRPVKWLDPWRKQEKQIKMMRFRLLLLVVVF